ncbi:MAG: serine/threonine-protein kinase [Myxococcota bacterium]
MTTVGLPAPLTLLQPQALADLALLELVARERGTVSLEPRGSHHVLVADMGDSRTVVARVESRVAEAAIARLAIVAGLPVRPGQSARLKVVRGSHRGIAGAGSFELLVAVRASAGGLGVDLHALATDFSHVGVAVLGLTDVSHAGEARYRIVEELGRGGMGIVYRAIHLGLQREVALKVLTPGMARSPAMAAQFVVEARAASRARHPNIVDVTDFGQLRDGRNFLVMELVRWPTLEQRLAGAPLEVKEALAIARGIAAGLQAAHAQGVVHRDLKPANVFVSPDNEVKLGDFGLALTSTEGVLPVDQLMGTPRYMAPEQAGARGLDHRVDLYALGCILYELLSGAPPFRGTELVEVLLRHEREPVPALPSSVPPGVVQLVLQLLAKSPDERPESADAVVAALGRLLAEREGWQRWVGR